jgi:cell division protein FtsL
MTVFYSIILLIILGVSIGLLYVVNTNKYTEEEVQKKISDLSTILHESRLSGGSLEIILENFLLNL